MAKDLAILAREIHDVAGDGEPANICPAVSAEVSQEKVWNEALLHDTSNPTTWTVKALIHFLFFTNC